LIHENLQLQAKDHCQDAEQQDDRDAIQPPVLRTKGDLACQ
jgi:hypothetical protein